MLTAKDFSVVLSVVQTPGNRVKAVTTASIKLGNVVVARGKFGGRWNGPQVLREFRKAPKRFTMMNTYTEAISRLLPA